MANQLDKFDQNIKDSLDQFEAPYNPEHWDELEMHLAATAPALSKYFSAITTGIAVTGIVFMSVMFMVSTPGAKENQEIAMILEESDDHINTNSNENVLIDENSLVPEEENIQPEDKSTTTDAAGKSVSTVNNEGKKAGTTSSQKETKDPKGDTHSTATIIDSASDKTEVEPHISPNITTGCTGLTIDFNGSEIYGKNAKYLWNFGDGFFSNESDPSHTFTKEGTFDVSLSVTSEESGQIHSNVVQTMIEIVEAPLANVEIEVISNEKLILSNNSYNANSITWIIDDEEARDQNSTEVVIADNTRYEVAFIAENKAGCTDTVYKNINISPAGSQFPKAFDISYSNSFAPGAIIDRGIARSLKIYAANGTEIFESSGNKGWDGTLNSGVKAEQGAYTWVMIVENEDIIDIVKGSLEVR